MGVILLITNIVETVADAALDRNRKHDQKHRCAHALLATIIGVVISVVIAVVVSLAGDRSGPPEDTSSYRLNQNEPIEAVDSLTVDPSLNKFTMTVGDSSVTRVLPGDHLFYVEVPETDVFGEVATLVPLKACDGDVRQGDRHCLSRYVVATNDEETLFMLEDANVAPLPDGATVALITALAAGN